MRSDHKLPLEKHVKTSVNAKCELTYFVVLLGSRHSGQIFKPKVNRTTQQAVHTHSHCSLLVYRDLHRFYFLISPCSLDFYHAHIRSIMGFSAMPGECHEMLSGERLHKVHVSTISSGLMRPKRRFWSQWTVQHLDKTSEA